jgi:hypothetical protein
VDSSETFGSPLTLAGRPTQDPPDGEGLAHDDAFAQHSATAASRKAVGPAAAADKAAGIARSFCPPAAGWLGGRRDVLRFRVAHGARAPDPAQHHRPDGKCGR